MTRPARKAGEPEVHPLPPVLMCTCPFTRYHQPRRLDRPSRRCVSCREYGAATTPPPVRVIRLAGGEALGFATTASLDGAWAVEYITSESSPAATPGTEEDTEWRARFHATRAAHLARLALGATLEAP